MRNAAIVAALLVTVGSAEAQAQKPDARRSAPIIAGETSVRVTPSGNVVAPVTALPSRDTNGRVRLRHHRMGPG